MQFTTLFALSAAAITASAQAVGSSCLTPKTAVACYQDSVCWNFTMGYTYQYRYGICRPQGWDGMQCAGDLTSNWANPPHYDDISNLPITVICKQGLVCAPPTDGRVLNAGMTGICQ
ncbi:UNVERIFIED_CONTAM: hypothetical protein HDU68_006739 [Siphonaria sp. JEL0065]|nr:hypothetical protein HDU68_006739 [Siphonaria sp. JEL0065]